MDRGVLTVEVHEGQHVKDGYADNFLVLSPQRPCVQCYVEDDNQNVIGVVHETENASEGGRHPVWEPVKPLNIQLDRRCTYACLKVGLVWSTSCFCASH
jgi:hypothetical protein